MITLYCAKCLWPRRPACERSVVGKGLRQEALALSAEILSHRLFQCCSGKTAFLGVGRVVLPQRRDILWQTCKQAGKAERMSSSRKIHLNLSRLREDKRKITTIYRSTTPKFAYGSSAEIDYCLLAARGLLYWHACPHTISAVSKPLSGEGCHHWLGYLGLRLRWQMMTVLQ